MNIFKKIVTTINANVDNTVSKYQNHDAIVSAGISEIKRALAETIARKNALDVHVNELQKQLDDNASKLTQWEQRAKELADSDSDRAMECLRRRNAAQKSIDRIKQQLEQNRTQSHTLASQIDAMQQRLEQNRQRQQSMRCRHRMTQASTAVNMDDCSQSLDDSFEKWEASVIGKELDGGAAVANDSANDSLAADFDIQEEQQALRAQLDALNK